MVRRCPRAAPRGQQFIAAENLAAARRMISAIREAAARLVQFPFLGHAAEPDPIRVLAVPRTPYLLFYVVKQDEVVIAAVWHGARAWPPIRP